MIIWIIYIAFSFFLDGIMSIYVNTNILSPSYFRTIFTIIAFTIAIDYFDNQKKYLYLLLIFGFLFDIVYTNTFLLNIVIFLIIYLFLKIIDNIIPNNLFMINLKAIISIHIYYIFTYLMLMFADTYYPAKLLGLILIRSIIATIIYTTISYITFKKIYKNKYDKYIK